MDFQMESVFAEKDERWDVTLSGEVDIFNSARLKQSLTDLLSQRSAHLTLHCRGLAYIDSTALGALVGVFKSVQAAGREMRLVDVKPNLLKLFRITKLDQVFAVEAAAEGGETRE